MKFLKENWFKIIIALIVSLIGFSFFYYYVIFLPQKEKTRVEAEAIKAKQAQQENERNIACASSCTYIPGSKVWGYLYWKPTGGENQEQELSRAYFPSQESCIKYCISDSAK